MDELCHLLDLIRLVRPRAALFTTYTFSVSHFDAVFIPVLRSVGCQDISVLVDADEAALSAEEARSHAAGRVYRIAPVVAPGGGVFHPKLAYLAAEDTDVLTVGSGNLTASGQSLQLESFDSVSAQSAPTVFKDLAQWMQQLASLIKDTSPQAAQLLLQTAPRARSAFQANAAVVGERPLPEPSLIHTLSGTAREALETVFIAEADRADAVTVLSPFHAPDGGPVLRLAGSLQAKSLAVGLDGGTKCLLAPFAKGRFKPELPTRFVLPDTDRNNKRLHAKVFELRAKDRVLVMTGSVNATAQSFESSMNVEVSLARWLALSPFAWKDADPQGYEATQEGSQFKAKNTLYVDAWLDGDRMLHGRLTTRASLSPTVRLLVSSGATDAYQADVALDIQGAFAVGPVPSFDTSKATLLTVNCGDLTATCWLNVHEELDIATEERERRAAIARVMRGEYAAEDIAEVIRLLSMVAPGLAQGDAAAVRPQNVEAKDEAAAEFSFMRWANSGRQRGGNTLLGRNPYELLKALNRWMNADLASSVEEDMRIPASKALKDGVQLLGEADAEQGGTQLTVDPYELLDKLCQAISVALERHPELESGAVLAEVVASRAVDRALKQDPRMAPCVSWLDRFSRFSYPGSAREDLSAVAAAMACVAAQELEAKGRDPQLSVLRETVERFAGKALSESAWIKLAEIGLARELYRRVAGASRQAAMAMASRLARAATLDDSLLALLRKASNEGRYMPGDEAFAFPEVATALCERRRPRQKLLRGLLNQAALDRAGCPFCDQALSSDDLEKLRQRHVLVHRSIRCNEILFFSEQHDRLADAFKEMGHA